MWQGSKRYHNAPTLNYSKKGEPVKVLDVQSWVVMTFLDKLQPTDSSWINSKLLRLLQGTHYSGVTVMYYINCLTSEDVWHSSPARPKAITFTLWAVAILSGMAIYSQMNGCSNGVSWWLEKWSTFSAKCHFCLFNVATLQNKPESTVWWFDVMNK